MEQALPMAPIKNVQTLIDFFVYTSMADVVNIISLLLTLLVVHVFPVAQSQHIVPSLPGYPGDLPFNLETGYIGVGELDEIQLFYYFIESERDPRKDPLLLWIAGGPGCSGFTGLAYEIGPLNFNYTDFDWSLPRFELNKYSWTKVANIIFLDQPVGTGFSYSTTSKGYSHEDDDTSATLHIYEFMRKWLIEHPRFIKNPLYITGDSYGGLWVPIVVQEIINGNEVGREPRMNIQGYSIGNPIVSADKSINSRVLYAYRVGLLSEDLYESIRESCNGEYVNVDPRNTNCVRDVRAVSNCLNYVNLPQILEPTCKDFSPAPVHSPWVRSLLMEDPHHFNLSNNQVPEDWCRSYNHILSYVWANDKKVQAALHIREGTVSEWVRCNKSLTFNNNIVSTFDYHRNLTQKYVRALVYSGDQDMVVPYLDTLEWVKHLNVTTTDLWRPWFVQGQVAGYTTKYEDVPYELTYATVKGAGHTGPEYKPEQCLAMIDRWLAYYSL